MTKPTGRPRGRPRKHPKPEDTPADTPAITVAPEGDEEGLIGTYSERAERKRMRLRSELQGLLSHGVLYYRPTELLRKAIIEGDLEGARMIADMAPEFFPAHAEEFAELAKEHLPDESEPGFREVTSYADSVAEFFAARRKLQRSTPRRHEI